MTASAVTRYPRLFLSLVKFEHTIFALPFAYIGAFLAVDGFPGGGDLLWITVAMVGARSLAMALNRLIDAGHRRAQSAHGGPGDPARRSPALAGRRLFCLLSLAVFLVAVYQLAPIVRWLWPIPVAAFVIYPYLKRATWLSHFWLGAVDGLAPVGAWAAVTNELPLEAWLLGAAVAVWVAGLRRPLRALRPRARPGARPPLGAGAVRRDRDLLGGPGLPRAHGGLPRARGRAARRRASSTGSAWPRSPGCSSTST